MKKEGCGVQSCTRDGLILVTSTMRNVSSTGFLLDKEQNVLREKKNYNTNKSLEQSSSAEYAVGGGCF